LVERLSINNAGVVTALLSAAGKVYIDADTTAHTDTAGALDVNMTTGTTNCYAGNFLTTNTATTGQNSYGLYGGITSSAVVTGTSHNLAGVYAQATKTGADTSVDTTSVYGVFSGASQIGSTDAGTRNTYGVHASATGDTAGASSAYGLYGTATGADTAYGVYGTTGGGTTQHAGYFDGNLTALLGAGDKVYIDATSTAHTDTAGALDVEMSTSTNGCYAGNFLTTNTATTGQNSYGLYGGITSGATVTGTNHNLTGIQARAIKTGPDTSVDINSVYALFATATQTGSTDAGTRDTYGVYAGATGDGNGTSTAYGVYATAASADTNYAVYAAAGDVVIASGNGLVVGHTSQITTAVTPEAQIIGVAGPQATLLIARIQNTAAVGGTLSTLSSNATSIGAYAAVADNDELGDWKFYADDGVDYVTLAAQFLARVDGTVAENQVPSEFVWKTSTSGGALTEVATLGPAGQFTLLTGGLTVTSGNTSITSAETTGDAFTFTASSLTTGRGLYVYSNSSEGSVRELVYVHNDSGTNCECLTLVQDGGANAINIDCNGNGRAIMVYDSQATTSHICNIASANKLTTGTCFRAHCESTAGAGSGSTTMFLFDRSGANTNATHTAYGIYGTVTNTGTTNTNVGAYLSASGASTRNWAVQAAAGDMTLTSGNLIIGSATDDTTAANVLQITSSTEPGGSIADAVQLYEKDSSQGAGHGTLGLYLEEAVEVIGTFTASHKIRVWINGTEYHIQLDAV
jgi:hypothetical protein